MPLEWGLAAIARLHAVFPYENTRIGPLIGIISFPHKSPHPNRHGEIYTCSAAAPSTDQSELCTGAQGAIVRRGC